MYLCTLTYYSASTMGLTPHGVILTSSNQGLAKHVELKMHQVAIKKPKVWMTWWSLVNGRTQLRDFVISCDGALSLRNAVWHGRTLFLRYSLILNWKRRCTDAYKMMKLQRNKILIDYTNKNLRTCNLNSNIIHKKGKELISELKTKWPFIKLSSAAHLLIKR